MILEKLVRYEVKFPTFVAAALTTTLGGAALSQDETHVVPRIKEYILKPYIEPIVKPIYTRINQNN